MNVNMTITMEMIFVVSAMIKYRFSYLYTISKLMYEHKLREGVFSDRLIFIGGFQK